jgi:hypothetical protein
MALILMQVDFASILDQISVSNLHLFALATLCVSGQIFFLNLRWHYILNAGRYNIPFERSALINITSYFANTLFVTSIGGIIAKSALAIKEGVSITHSILATAIDRFMTLATLIILAVFSLPVLSGVLDTKTETMLALSLLVIIASTALFFFLLRCGFLDEYIKSSHRLLRLTAAIRSFVKDPAIIIKVTYNSVFAQSLFFLSTFILSTNMDYDGSTLQFFALLPVLALIASLPISFGGWGVREGAFIYGLGTIGFSIDQAFLLSVQVGLVTLIAPFIVALPYAFKKENNLFFFLQETRKTSKTKSYD